VKCRADAGDTHLCFLGKLLWEPFGALGIARVFDLEERGSKKGGMVNSRQIAVASFHRWVLFQLVDRAVPR
jgi:hypothetical protein